MNNTPRFLPVALVFAVALLAVKASDVWEGAQQLINRIIGERSIGSGRSRGAGVPG